ncbi:HK97 family phage prohead protease [Spiroplasma citri]|uniref:HK97 family phage prohead protease n=1 Tax=Spiroplasma citri TaxID=2133 RepID=A0AAX3SX96_SPICI|nr:HK97 family phage prohead protease [Spiroplasma citri]WFG95879.1 HK97 family phage prohead protease [Spiroplasma citri]WFG99761.1 HK97 family phage prohead protease [Spiroplasma citri]
MKKILAFLLSSVLLTTSTSNLISCYNSNFKENKVVELIGIANKYNIVDSKGSFFDKKSFENQFKQNKIIVPIFLEHKYDYDNFLGIAKLENCEDGLWVKMRLYTNTIKGKNILYVIKQMQEENRPMQLSIGAKIDKDDLEIKKIHEKEAVYIKNAIVSEVSLVIFGANPQSEIKEIKNI